MQTVGPYSLVRTLGGCEVGEVWSGADAEGTRFTVAILTAPAATDQRWREAFAATAYALSQAQDDELPVVGMDLAAPTPWVACADEPGLGAAQIFIALGQEYKPAPHPFPPPAEPAAAPTSGGSSQPGYPPFAPSPFSVPPAAAPEPVPAQPVSAQPGPAQPGTAQPGPFPAAAQPVSAQPGSPPAFAPQPFSPQPFSPQPVSPQPVSAQPVSPQPVSAEPVSAPHHPWSAAPTQPHPAQAQPVQPQPAQPQPGQPQPAQLQHAPFQPQSGPPGPYPPPAQPGYPPAGGYGPVSEPTRTQPTYQPQQPIYTPPTSAQSAPPISAEAAAALVLPAGVNPSYPVSAQPAYPVSAPVYPVSAVPVSAYPASGLPVPRPPDVASPWSPPPPDGMELEPTERGRVGRWVLIIATVIALLVGGGAGIVIGANVHHGATTAGGPTPTPTPSLDLGLPTTPPINPGVEPPIGGGWPGDFARFKGADPTTTLSAGKTGLGFDFQVPQGWECNQQSKGSGYVKYTCGVGSTIGGDLIVRNCPVVCNADRRTAMRRVEEAWGLTWIRSGPFTTWAETTKVDGAARYGLVYIGYWRSVPEGPLDRQLVFRMTSAENQANELREVVNSIRDVTFTL